MKSFALLGAAGYVAKKHLDAIKYSGHQLLAVMDPSDSVGILDSYFPDTKYFKEFERFDRYIDKANRSNERIDFLSICTPNYMHDAHCRFALRNNMDAICEKPLVLNPWNIDALQKLERETGHNINNILQLRLHPSIIALKNYVDSEEKERVFEVELTYITSRGPWYLSSWKGEYAKSGGIATNIGVHFFDVLLWIFGKVKRCIVNVHEDDIAAGYLELEKANIRWLLSINRSQLPEVVMSAGQTTYRSIKIEDQDVEFSTGFEDLHRQSYQEILIGNGFPTSVAQPVIQLIHDIRSASPIGVKGEYHPRLKF